jgi:hypothetical protein
MAVREVVAQFTIDLDPHGTFSASLPVQFLEREPDGARVQELWTQFIDSVNKRCRVKCSFAFSRSTKRIVFQSGMEKDCKEFSRRTANIKIHFQMRGDVDYGLRVVLLTDIPQEVLLAGPSYLAEIPQPIIEADPAEFLVHTEGDPQISAVRVDIIDNHPSAFINYLDADDHQQPIVLVDAALVTCQGSSGQDWSRNSQNNLICRKENNSSSF